MFYFFLPALMSYNVILIAAAVIPALFLMVRVYQLDRLERENPYLTWALIRAGIFSSLIAMVAERVLSALLRAGVKDAEVYNILLYFVIVAFSEEGAKYFMMRKNTWGSREFNCQYDGIVYAVFVSLGFALWENISYVLHYGFSTAIVRALTAIPGHTCFGVFMGVFYGLARKYENRGMREKSQLYRFLALLIPALLHGAYDYIASVGISAWYFVGFIAALFAISYLIAVKISREDRYI